MGEAVAGVMYDPRRGISPASRHGYEVIAPASHGRAWLQNYVDGVPVGGLVKSRRRLLREFDDITRAYAHAVVSAPGLLGLAFGLALPFAPLSLLGKVGAGAVIGVAGYASPEGSWLRRFSIGAGVGGAVSSSYLIYRSIPNFDQLGSVLLKAVRYGTQPGLAGTYAQYVWGAAKAVTAVVAPGAAF